MIKYINKNKWTILILVAFIAVGSWYFLNSRKMYEEPEKADLVLMETNIR
ncbi:hypothetical protein [Alkaliphilus transvaalensis]|nr:hypothetical protein [Alkaliphilus transvaalensis]